jgi:hypothetical protein
MFTLLWLLIIYIGAQPDGLVRQAVVHVYATKVACESERERVYAEMKVAYPGEVDFYMSCVEHLSLKGVL